MLIWPSLKLCMFGQILTSYCKDSHKLNKMDICVLFLKQEQSA